MNYRTGFGRGELRLMYLRLCDCQLDFPGGKYEILNIEPSKEAIKIKGLGLALILRVSK